MNTEPSVLPSEPTQPTATSPQQPSYPYSVVFVVLLLVFIVATLVTFILPESFASKARIRVNRDVPDIKGMHDASSAQSAYDPYFLQTELELMQSELVLSQVVQRLNLMVEWGKKYAAGERLRMQESMALLKARLDLRPVRNTSLLEICVYSEDAQEAADLANALAETYRDYRLAQSRLLAEGGIGVLQERLDEQEKRIQQARQEIEALQKSIVSGWPLDEARQRLEELQSFRRLLSMKLSAEKIDLTIPKTTMVEIVDRAVPAVRPVRPNKPLNIMLGIVVGVICGLTLATVVFVLQRAAYRRTLGLARAQLPPRIRAILHITIALMVGVVIGYYCALPVDYSILIVLPLALFLGGCASAFIELRSQETPASAQRAEQPPQRPPYSNHTLNSKY